MDPRRLRWGGPPGPRGSPWTRFSPASGQRGPTRASAADQGVRPTIVAGPLLFGYLLATGSYKFRVLDGCIGAAGFAGFPLLGTRWRDYRQERGRHVGQFGFLFRAQRLDEVRRH